MFFLTKIKSHRIAIMIGMLTLMLAGCWDRTELNDLAIITSAGLNMTDDEQIELSLQIIDPQALDSSDEDQGGDPKPFTVFTATGETIFDATSKIQSDFSRELFWGQNQVVIIGKKMAEIGIHNDIDFFARHPFPRLRTEAFVTLTEKPVDILKMTPTLEINSAEIARKLVKQKTGMNVTLKGLLKMLSSDTKSAALPLLEIVKNSMGKPALEMTGTAIFNQGKMIGNIDEQVTRGVLWVRDENEATSVTIQPKNTRGHISFHLLKAESKLIPEIKADQWKIIIDIVTIDDAVENKTTLNLMDPEITKQLEKEIGDSIKQRIHLALEHVQKELKSDILGFGKAFHHHYPKQWAQVKDHWDEKFPEIEVEIRCKVTIERPGRSSSTQGIPEDEVIEK